MGWKSGEEWDASSPPLICFALFPSFFMAAHDDFGCTAMCADGAGASMPRWLRATQKQPRLVTSSPTILAPGGYGFASASDRITAAMSVLTLASARLWAAASASKLSPDTGSLASVRPEHVAPPVAIWWTTDTDAAAGGEGAKGFRMVSWHGVGANYPAFADIKKLVIDGGWNHYYVIAKGHHIQAWLNGVKTIDIVHDAGFADGNIGFQLCHGDKHTTVDVKTLYIREM